MSSTAATTLASLSTQKCAFCAEEILAHAKKCKHCGEFVNGRLSAWVSGVFALGVMIACILAGFQKAASEGVLAVGVWAIFALLFARILARA